MTMNRENEQLLQAGISAVRAGDRKEGARLLAQVVRKEPQSEEAWFWLAAATDQPAEAQACLRRVLTINPANTRAQQALSMLESGQGANAFNDAAAASMPAVAPAMPDPYAPPTRALNTGELLAPPGLDNRPSSAPPPPPFGGATGAGTPPPPPFGGAQTPGAPPPPPFGGAPNWANNQPGVNAPASSSLNDPYGGSTMAAAPVGASAPPPPFTGGGGLRLGQLDPNAPTPQATVAPPPPLYDPGADLRASLLSEQAQAAPVAPPVTPPANAKNNKKGKDADKNKNAQAQQKGAAAVRQRRGATAVVDPNDPKAKKKRGFNPLFLALAVLVLFLVVAAVLFLLRPNSNTTATDTPVAGVVDTTATAIAGGANGTNGTAGTNGANGANGTAGAAGTGVAGTTPGAVATGLAMATGIAATSGSGTNNTVAGGATVTNRPGVIATVGGTPGAQGQTTSSGGSGATTAASGTPGAAGTTQPGGQTAASGTPGAVGTTQPGGQTAGTPGAGTTQAGGTNAAGTTQSGGQATGVAGTAGANLTAGTLPPRGSVTPRPTVAGTVANSGNSTGNATPGLSPTAQGGQLPTIAGGGTNPNPTSATNTTRVAEVPTPTPLATLAPLPTLSGGQNSASGTTPPVEVVRYLDQTRTYLNYSRYFQTALGVGVVQPYRAGRIRPGVTRINVTQLYQTCRLELLISEQDVLDKLGDLPIGNDTVILTVGDKLCEDFAGANSGGGSRITGTPVVTPIQATPTVASDSSGPGPAATTAPSGGGQITPGPTATTAPRRTVLDTPNPDIAVPVALQRVWMDTPLGPRIFYRFLITGGADIGQTTLSLGRMARIIKDQTVPNDAYELHQLALEYANDLSGIADNIDRFFYTGEVRYLEQASILYDKAQRDSQRWADTVNRGYPFKVGI